MTIAVYCGSFDPITNGHLHVIEKASKLFDKLVVLIAENTNKTGMFTPKERLVMINISIKELSNVNVDILEEGLYVVNYAEKIGATHLIRGLPTIADFQYEYELFHVNKSINSKVETVFLMCDKEVQQYRSSIVKSLVGYKGWIKTIKDKVPQIVLYSLLKNHLKKNWKELNSQYYCHYVESEWNKLVKRYNDRFYHNFFHLYEMLNGLKEMFDKSNDNFKERYDLLQYAIWYHDFYLKSDIDYSGKLSPEVDSALYAEKVIESLGMGEINAINVKKLIQATEHGQNSEYVSEDIKMIVSLDLMILASDWEDYKEYVNQIRKEYSRFSDVEWKNGRIVFLNSMLEKQVIFPHFSFKEREILARNNMKKELLELENIKEF